jgi:hypothetical protein
MNKILYFFLICFLLGTVFFSGSLAEEDEETSTEVAKEEPKQKGGKKNWNKMVDSLDKEWESGDDPTELEHEFEYNRKILAKRQPKFNMQDGDSIRKAYESDPFAFSGGGGMMIFVDLKPKKDGTPYTKDDMDKLSKRYASLLRSGSVIATVYNLMEKRLLVQLEKSWYTKDTFTFLAQQPEVAQFEANSKVYKPEDYLQRDEDDDEDL